MTGYEIDRTCPHCGHDHLCSPREAKAVFRVSAWGVDALLDDPDATRVCSFCHRIKIDGEWEHLSSVGERAWDLAQASDTKSKDDYALILRGLEP